MNVRLVAYRKATSGASSTTAYNLDLQEAPNISLNYQFSDVKEPETRKGSFSQTFKLPFTDNNNQFFQDWYNVNLDTLVFNTRTKFDAVLYIGAVPQFEGALQLKSVYKKAQCYEVVLMSSSASLFSTIGEQRLKDVFKEDNGSYSADLNHVYNNTNIEASWNGGSSSFQNAAGTALRDTDFDVQKVMYPISVTREKFYYGSEARYLNLDQTNANTLVSDSGVEAAYDYSVDINQFRPAIQIKYLFDRIMAKAGFSYTSDFISGTGDYSSDKYFGKIFMTTGTALEQSALPTTNTNAAPSGVMQVSNNAQWGVNSISAGDSGCKIFDAVVPANTTSASGTCTTPADPDSIWNTTNNYFTKQDTTMEQVVFSHIPAWSNFKNCGGTMTIRAYLREWDVATGAATDVIYGDSSEFVVTALNLWNSALTVTHSLSLEEMPPGKSAQIIVEVNQLQQDNAGSGSTFTFGFATSDALNCGTFYNTIRIDWVGYSTNIFGATVDVPACIDADITQRAFLKDIIQRFNLVILTDPNDDTNLIIEPYDDFIASGEIKQWTDKLDTSKEIVVKDTTELQKKTIHLTDQEDVDLYNKSFKERYPEVNVFGHLKIDEFNNEFATGELKNESIFSPYINSQVFVTDDEQFGTLLPNMAVQYEYSYENNDGVFANKIKKTKPKLYWYNGTATNTLSTAGSQVNYYMHKATATAITAYTFNTYPVCTPFDITPSSNVYTLSEDNRSLYWNATPPIVGNLQVFNYQGYIGNWFNKTLYGEYWKPYLDNIYSSEARIMECYLNLNEVDIFDFSFADEIFIKDTYWRILKIQNYQVGAKASTKVTLIKSLDTRSNCNGCDYSIGTVGDSNLLFDTFYLWCPDDNPGCTPDTTAPNFLGTYTSPECCTCNGGIVMWNYTSQASNGLYPCIANASSLPLRIKSILSSTNILNQGQLRTLIYDKLGGRDRPLIRGVNNTKYSQNLLPTYGDDIIIKYKSKNRKTPQYSGENHRITLSGYTVGNTSSFAYPEGDPYGKPLLIPDNVNLLVRVNTLVTVVGGTSATYPLGRTEAVAYYAGFRITKGQVIRVGTAGGVQEFSITEATIAASCTMNIQVQANADGQNVLTFGLADSQTDTKRLWNLKADISVNRINNMNLEYDGNWALFQNGDNILFQNGDYMLWN
tara:strand:+ start:1646 stop:5131 length:3486 start_codon:yes stop_codon:yes gene_type:complete